MKQHKLSWLTHTYKLAILADQLSKTIQKKEKLQWIYNSNN